MCFWGGGNRLGYTTRRFGLLVLLVSLAKRVVIETYIYIYNIAMTLTGSGGGGGGVGVSVGISGTSVSSGSKSKVSSAISSGTPAA